MRRRKVKKKMTNSNGFTCSLGIALVLSLAANCYLCGCVGLRNISGFASKDNSSSDNVSLNVRNKETLEEIAKSLSVEVSKADSDIDIVSNIKVQITDSEKWSPPPLSEECAAGIKAVLSKEDAELFKRQQGFLKEIAGKRVLVIPRGN